jgi:hypothetical protein
MRRHFHKMHGLGNDFVIVDAREQPFGVTPALAKAIADRRTGVMTSFAASALSFLAFPMTRETSGILSNEAPSSSAAQPVTRIQASGRRRCACRIAWRV